MIDELKKWGISFGISIGIILIGTMVATIFHYINFFHAKVMTVVMVLIPVIALLVSGFITGKKSHQNGWLEGIKISVIFLLFLLLFDYLALAHQFQVKDFLYYFILMASGTIGSMVGINFKKETATNTKAS